MSKTPEGLVQKRRGSATEPLRRLVVFFTPLRLIQLLGFVLILALCLNFSKAPFFQPVDNYFYDQYLKRQPQPATDPGIVYIGIDKKSLQTVKAFPWPKRYYAAMTRILREWGAKAIVFNLFLTQGGGAAEDDQALVEELQKTPNVYLPISFESEGFKNYYYVNQSDAVFSGKVKGIGHINYSQDADNVIRRIYPFVKFNQKLVPHLGILVAYDYLGKPVPTPEKCDFPRDARNNLMIHWAKKWNDVVGYYSYSDILNSYALGTKGQPASIGAEDIKGKICLIGLTVSDSKMTPLDQSSPGIGVVGNIINTILTRQFIRVPSPWFQAFLLLVLGILAGWLFIPFRLVFSVTGGIVLGLVWIVFSYLVFAVSGLWLGVAVPLTLVFAFFLLSFLLTRVAEYRERLYFLNLALRDELTGLYVMRYVSTFLAQAMHYAQTFRKPFAVILFDLDDFKQINDTYGYRTGNIVLKKVAEVIHNSIRTKGRALPDVAGRYGDEEFIVLLVGFNLATATFGIAERIRKAIEKVTFEGGPKGFSVSVSAGVSVLKPGERNPNKVIERAQEALLKAKAAGKNQTCLSSD
ncbi:MAG TPA: CHASE2 domain-containing protein [Candidatus Omnitrophota bacterium]|nr:CHASE2 domain-containing protein [Candidatus Omnitrophota bacterium]HPS36281.1 CHASE2 domain-containing protein [Candidatus Omnitrophota bacterium]